MIFNLNKSTLLVALCLVFTRCRAQNETTVTDDAEPEVNLTMLGENSWARFRPGWSLTVNEQCLYEFIFQFEHDESLPLGPDLFAGACNAGNVNKTADGKFMHEVRSFWEKFPDYVWATIGFNHMSLDWHPCGIFSGTDVNSAGLKESIKGYETAQYAFSFFRVTPEFRAEKMTCTLNENVIVPGELVCADNQEKSNNVNGMGFFILPSSIVPVGTGDRTRVVNMPKDFTFPIQGQAQQYVGLRQWELHNIPLFPEEWYSKEVNSYESLPLFMSTYGGDLAMWQPHIAYKRVSGPEDVFSSNSKSYYQHTFATPPDTFSVDYDASDGIIRFHMIGKSQLCREDFLRAQGFAGGMPQFPNYDDLEFLANLTENGFDPQGGGNRGAGGGASGASGQNPALLWSAALALLSFWL